MASRSSGGSSSGARRKGEPDYEGPTEIDDPEKAPRRRKEDRTKRTSSGLQQRFVDVLGWGIFSLWATGFAVDMINIFPEWDLPAGIWGLMTIVSGAAFVAQAIKRDGGE